ncbi:hypothetical protein BX616_011359 [Lobosporangium transversale]|uniref:EamA domain-containing protein n=1 Tax=Lobosporangium transversale TaxID=64571 RepID=A0A1Y2H2M0_9FUNG|nr:hypothetical protein BCR41DRAFT_383770 [Lobosporangium transversale]KAF9917768.1 hypothetical protein BX616_011359 [Lobosporangium transversale]ORZ27302.1 hypothetical protein BCR41DRAFT_383770 [Lobosporangium transversale]|eukprot:XP_021885029.1 hypothetical protein BCR41DRAFT_383770 [Lobosporangium transversale]
MSGYRPRKSTATARKRNAVSASRGLRTAIPTAILAGTFAALASVFAKLTLDVRTINFLQYACNSFIAPTTPYCTTLFIAKEGETSPVVVAVRTICFALIFICNAVMWTLFTKALNRSKSSATVTVINSAANFCLTAVLGYALFSEPLTLQWWFGACLIVLGSVLVSSSEASKQKAD